MKEFVISEVKAETAVLVGLITQEQNEEKTREYLDELEFLADTAGAVTVRRFTQRLNAPSRVSYVGKGKLEEIKQYILAEEEAEREVGMVIFDDELSAKQMRNIERELNVKILDRTLTYSPCVHKRPVPRRRWNWHSIATCCPGCNASGHTSNDRAADRAAVEERARWDCAVRVKHSLRWTAASSSRAWLC